MGVGITEATEWIEIAERGSVESVAFSARSSAVGFSGSKLGRWMDARLLAEPEQADVVHGLLAHLAERMIEMHQEKQTEVRSFLDLVAEEYERLAVAHGHLIDQVADLTNRHQVSFLLYLSLYYCGKHIFLVKISEFWYSSKNRYL